MSTWVLLRGLTRETRHWGRLPAALRESLGQIPDRSSCGQTTTATSNATTTAGIRLLLLDLPGNGEYVRLRAPASVAGIVAFVRQAALESGVPGPYNIIAMSLGGMVATDWAQRHPGEIERLVLINTSMRPFSRMHERLRPSAWPGLLGVAAHWGDAADAESGIHRLTCNNLDTLAADLAAWTTIRRSAPVSRANALRQLWAAARFNAAPAAPGVCPADSVVGGRWARQPRLFREARGGVGRAASRASVGRPRSAARRSSVDRRADSRVAHSARRGQRCGSAGTRTGQARALSRSRHCRAAATRPLPTRL
ncbi:pimeloyl-ACP methyl ester carboxylesterase [Paraburkholderia sp. JPY681]|nr:pimeloyl-ACP methyl ester carboxylesterase [Paraburkholderia atlantica]